MEHKHILICGERGVGKSTLIRKLVQELDMPVWGFVTEKRPIENTLTHGVYINPAEGERQYCKGSMVGFCYDKKWDTYPHVFDEVGTQLLQAHNGIIVMDELGFMEAQAKAFTQKVMAALDGNIPVIAAVKAMDGIAFLDNVRNHHRCACYTITKENRDELLEQLKQVVMQWKV